jgi:hypothetical protein
VKLRSLLALWFAGSLILAEAATPQKYSYWVESCSHPESGCQPNDPELAAWALEAWQNASRRAIELSRMTDPRHARIRIFWATAEQGLYGEARPVLVDGQRGAEVYVRSAPLRTGDDKLMRDAIVYLTCLHEAGHALGLPHTAAFDDIMYSFQYGGDIPEYFGRYRRKLHARDDIHKNSGMSEADRKRLLDVLDSRQ